jgi:four helix bundle protein
VIAEATLDHARLEVDRLSIDYVAFSYRIAKSLSGIHRPAGEQWWRAAQSISLNIAEGNGKQSLKDKNRFFKMARGSALECASIHDVLRVCDAMNEESNLRRESDLK